MAKSDVMVAKRGLQLVGLPLVVRFTLILSIFTYVLVGVLLCVPVVFAEARISVISYNSSIVTQSQDLEFEACVDEGFDKITMSILCDETLTEYDVSSLRLNSSCAYGVKNIAFLDCDALKVQAVYWQGDIPKKIRKDVSVSTILVTPTQILSAQSWDGGWGTASSTAYAIWVLSQFNDTYAQEIADGLVWLKDHRSPTSKCWYVPGSMSVCGQEETILTLRYLEASKLYETNRIVSDGRSFIESAQHFIADSKWSVIFTTDEDNVTCNMSVGGSSVVSDETLTADTPLGVDITAAYGSVVNFSCDQTVFLDIRDDRNVSRFQASFADDSERDYDFGLYDDQNDTLDALYKIVVIPQPCWGVSLAQFSECDLQTTLFALGISISDARKTDAKEWVVSNFLNHQVAGHYPPVAKMHYAAAYYLKYVDSADTDTLDWLLYSQNNDGSFGVGTTTSKLEATTMAIKALSDLTFPQKKEVLADAIAWVSSQFTTAGYHSIPIDGGIFQTLYGNIGSFLLVESNTSDMLDGASISLIFRNPTRRSMLNVTYNITPNYFSIKAPSSINASQSVPIQLTPIITDAGFHMATLVVGDGTYPNTTYRRIYAFVNNTPSFSIDGEESMYHIYGSSGATSVTVVSTNGKVSCNASWGDAPLVTSSEISFSAAGPLSVPFKVKDISEGKIVAVLNLSCGLFGLEKSFTYPVTVFVHGKPPFSVTPTEITSSSFESDYPFEIKSDYGESINVTVSFDKGATSFEIDPASFILEPGKVQHVSMRSLFPSNESAIVLGTIHIKGLDHDASIPLTISFTVVPPTLTWLWWLIGSVVLGCSAFAAYWFRKQLKAYGIKYWGQIRFYIHEQLPLLLVKIPGIGKRFAKQSASPQGGKKGVKRDYLLDVISIMKGMDKTEKDIIDKLMSEGFTHDQVRSILSQLADVERQIEGVKHEDTVLSIIKSIDANIDVVTKVLKEKGFAESEIREALREISSDTEVKDKRLREDAGFKEDEKL